jgi:hypothetical protein
MGFGAEIAVGDINTEFSFDFVGRIPWLDFELNPRRLRGSDFLMRWSQGVWSERRIIEGVNATNVLYAIPYGPSSTAPTGSVREFELYFERLEAAGQVGVKRPDILLFPATQRRRVEALVGECGGAAELPFVSEADRRVKELLALAVVAVESENSLWRAAAMPEFGQPLRPMRRMKGLPGLPKNAVVPTIILKEEDRKPLVKWQSALRVPVHIWHVFYDRAWGISLDEAERVIKNGLIEPTEQVFQAPGGATTRKAIHKIFYHYAYELGQNTSDPQLVADSIEDKNGHILPFVRFEGGELRLCKGVVERVLTESRRP